MFGGWNDRLSNFMHTPYKLLLYHDLCNYDLDCTYALDFYSDDDDRCDIDMTIK